MINFVMKDPGPTGTVGLVAIDIGHEMGRLRAAAGSGKLNQYLVSCACVQAWADLISFGELNGMLVSTPMSVLNEQFYKAQYDADRTAQMLLGTIADVVQDIEHPSTAYFALHEKSPLDLLNKVLHIPMPECCGYDLSDLELIVNDVDRLIAEIDLDRPLLIVGVRTGGVYLAPLWKAALARLGVTDVHWCTIRPYPGCVSSDRFEAVRLWIEHRIDPVIVIVDDRPDTGATMELVAAQLRQFTCDLWFSCVGSFWRGPMVHPIPRRSQVCMVRDDSQPRLWECLLPDQQPGFFARLRQTAGLPSIPEQAQLHFRCPQGEVRYGHGRAWLPWNDPRVRSETRWLINPRKTPIEVIRADGQPLLHLRFTGECVFGRAEFERVRKMAVTGPAWLVDGYTITVDVGNTRSFLEQFHVESQEAKARLLLEASRFIISAAREPVALTLDSPVVMRLESRWSAVGVVMRDRWGGDLMEIVPDVLRRLLVGPIVWPGRLGKVFRSSLRYNIGSWHWQIDQSGKLHHFQLEANWGDVSFLELEVGAFILENCLGITDAMQLVSLCSLRWSSVRETLPLAALMIVESRVRSVRAPSERGRIAHHGDFHQLIRTTSELTEINGPSWI